MSLVRLQEDSKGATFTFSCVQGDGTTALDLSSSTVTFELYDPNGMKSSHTCTVSSPATAGICTYTTAAADLSIAGRWKGQLLWHDATHDIASDVFDLDVRANIFP